MLSDKEFAEKAVWLQDGQITYDFTFTEKDVVNACKFEDYKSELNTIEAVLSAFCATPKERRTGALHWFAYEFFDREVENGMAMDYFLAEDDVAPTYKLLKFVDGKCTLRAAVPFVLVEHWVFRASWQHYANLLQRQVKLPQKKLEAIAKLFKTTCSHLEVIEYMDSCMDVAYENHDKNLELIMRDLRLPYVPAAWYKTRAVMAEQRRAAAAAKEEAAKIEGATVYG